MNDSRITSPPEVTISNINLFWWLAGKLKVCIKRNDDTILISLPLQVGLISLSHHQDITLCNHI